MELAAEKPRVIAQLADLDVDPVGRLAGDVGRGLVAGLIGTAAMTVSSRLEARIRERGSSSTPALAAQRAFDINQEPESVRELYGRHRFGQSCLLARLVQFCRR